MYLSKEERLEAPYLQKILQEMRERVLNLSNQEWNQNALLKIEEQALSQIQARGWQPDYLSIRKQSNLLPLGNQDLGKKPKMLILAAAKLGQTRLIDNLEIELEDTKS
jgi:pantoate--beta-alanine ligase